MNKTNFLYALACTGIIVALTSCNLSDDLGSGKDVKHNFETLIKDFQTPPIDYSTAPFWVWNDIVTKEKIDQQLPEFKKLGMSQVFIHPRPGLITEYLSEEWFELCKYAVDKGKELEMKIWLYDENSFPSGFAGGHVISVMPPSFDPVAGLRLTRLDVITPADTNEYLLVIKKIGDNFANISGGLARYIGQPGTYYAFSKWYYPENDAWYGGFSYVDLLAYGITERFINTTMQGYEEYLGEDLGNTVPGIFTDEPNINTSGDNWNVIRFTPVLFNKFLEKYGYQLENYLPCLYDEIGDWKNVRHDYYALLLDMFIERWSIPWNQYSEEKNLIWTGHYWEHGWPDPKHGGDNMAMYAWHQYPGIDMLFNYEERRPDQFGNVRAVKELSSVVNQLGKERALSETYGGSGWELTFEDMKRLGDWEYALGVNFMNQHLAYMTIKGARKRDFPQSMSYHAPWWDNYKPLNNYFERLSLALSYGQQVNRILILEPTSSAWMYYTARKDKGWLEMTEILNRTKDSFHDLLGTLEKNQIGYDLGSERIIKDHGDVQNDQFIIGDRAYDLVVLPHGFENFEPYVFDLIKRYLAGGGKVLSFNSIPQYLDGNLSKSMPAFIKGYTAQWIEKDELTRNIIDDYFTDPQFTPVDPEHWGGRIFHQRRQFRDGQLLFIVNFDTTQTGKFEFKVRGRKAVSLDAFTGKHTLYPSDLEEDNIVVKGHLPPGGSKLLFISKKSMKVPETVSPQWEDAQLVQTNGPEIFPRDPNMMTLDYCDLELNGESFRDLYFYTAAEKIFASHLKETYGYNYNPWSVAVQYRQRILDKNNFEKGTGFKAHFPFHIENSEEINGISAVIEWPQLYTISCNGKQVDAVPGDWWLDRSFGVFNISDQIVPGKNVITIVADPMDIHAELEPVYLIGDFGVSSTQEGWLITAPQSLRIGSWKEMGLPFYAGSVAYKKSIEVEGQVTAHKVRLNKWHGSVTEVFVNGQSAGIIGWQPYELDITEWLKPGDNEIEVSVTGSLKNLLGPHHNNPNVGLVTPWSFFFAPDHQPPGDQYHQLDYGLFEDFQIIKL